jgi:hypothetical protein
MNERYLLQKGTETDSWCCTDTQYNIVCTWKNKQFNATQKVTMLYDNIQNVGQLATAMRELGDWLSKNHPDKCF